MAVAGPWTFVNGSRSDIWNAVFGNAGSYKVALLNSSSNIGAASTTFAGVTGELATANGYTAGGAAVALTTTGTTSLAVYFSSNPTWTATGGTLTARYACLYKVGGDVLAYCLLDNTPADVQVASGNPLTVKSDNTASNPVFNLV